MEAARNYPLIQSTTMRTAPNSTWRKVVSLSHLPTQQIAEELGVKHKYVTMVLNKEGLRKPTPIIKPKPKKEPYFFTHDPYYNF